MRPVFDSLFHYLRTHPLHESAALLEEECRLRDVTRLGILACPSEGTPQDPIQNAQEIGLKKLLFPKAYAFAGLMHNKEFSDEEQAKDFVRQAALYYEAGFDGMKMPEGKPYCGIGADEELIQKAYGENAYRVLGATPVPINEEATREIIAAARPKVAPGSFEEEEINTLTELFK